MVRVPSLHAGHGRLAPAGASCSSDTEYQRLVLRCAGGAPEGCPVSTGTRGTLDTPTLRHDCVDCVALAVTDRFPGGPKRDRRAGGPLGRRAEYRVVTRSMSNREERARFGSALPPVTSSPL